MLLRIGKRTQPVHAEVMPVPRPQRSASEQGGDRADELRKEAATSAGAIPANASCRARQA
jgi:hypothetical protein